MFARGSRSYDDKGICQNCKICQIINKSIKSLHICRKKDDRTVLICSHSLVSYSIDKNITFLVARQLLSRAQLI